MKPTIPQPLVLMVAQTGLLIGFRRGGSFLQAIEPKIFNGFVMQFHDIIWTFAQFAYPTNTTGEQH